MAEKKSRCARILMAFGAIFVVAALLLTFYARWAAQKASESTDLALNQLEAVMPATHAGSLVSSPDTASKDLDGHPSMPVAEIAGNSYIGVISIDSLDLELPVLSKWDTDLLGLGPCRYSGSVYDRSLIIVGSDLQSHFGRLKSLSTGEAVTFTDVDGQVFSYQVVGIDSPIQVDKSSLESDDRDLTLYEYDSSGGRYIVVRCSIV